LDGGAPLIVAAALVRPAAAIRVFRDLGAEVTEVSAPVPLLGPGRSRESCQGRTPDLYMITQSLVEDAGILALATEAFQDLT
jgi:hypothetical protein